MGSALLPLVLLLVGASMSPAVTRQSVARRVGPKLAERRSARIDSPAVALLGIWDVEHVAVDKQDTIHQTYVRDDPELMAGTLVIDKKSARLTVGEVACEQAERPAHVVTWKDLFARTFPRPRVGGRSSAPTPEDFGIAVSRNAKTVAYSLCTTRTQTFPNDTWVALNGSDVMFLRGDPQVLFVLRRRTPVDRPTPSFDCTKTNDVTSREICGSFELAAWERSVALALTQVTELFPEKASSVKASQIIWLRDLHACGNDSACIETSLRSRVAALAWERKT